MGVKSWNVKLLIDRPELRTLLESNLKIWNDGCRLICLSLLALRRAEPDSPQRKCWEYIRAKSGNWHLVYWLTQKPDPKKNSDDVRLKVELAQAFQAEAGGFDQRLGEARRLLGVHWQQAVKASIERVKSYEAKLKMWTEDHDAWQNRKEEWEAANGDYMRMRPMIEAFQREAGASRGSRIRWHKWLTFLSSPEVVQWRDASAMFIPPTAEEMATVRRNRRRAVRLESELVYARNPQLLEFNKLHGTYEREFARTYAKRKHCDGFRQRPTFTLPALPKRPEWPRFQRDQNWRLLNLDSKTIELRLLDDSGKNFWCKLQFVADPRFREIRRLLEAEKIGQTKYEYAWRTPGGQLTQIEPQGAKLIFRRNGIYLGISFNVQPAPSRSPFKQSAATKYSHQKQGQIGWPLKTFRDHNPTVDVVTCAVDLAIRHLGAVSIAKEGALTARRILQNRVSLPGSEIVVNIPSLVQIGQVQRKLRRNRRRSGKMSPDKASCRRLQEHYRNMQEDRFKKAAFFLCNYATYYGADFLIFEDLKQLSPDTANERGVNSALSRWNRGAIIDFATKIAEDFGLRVVKVPSYHTSRICARCNSVGHRFEQGLCRPFRRKRSEFSASNDDRRAIRLAFLGTWFYCPKCRRRVHADINASENLHRVFLGNFPKAKRDGEYLIVDGDRIELAGVKSAVEEQLTAATIGPSPF